MRVGILHERWQPQRTIQRDEGVDHGNYRETVWETPELAAEAGESSDADFWFVVGADVFGKADVESVGG